MFLLIADSKLIMIVRGKKMFKNLKSAWVHILAALLGGIASAYIGTNVSFGFGLLFIFLLLSGVSMLVILVFKKVIEFIYKYFNRTIQNYKTLKEKARLYDEHQEREKNSIKHLGPPFTNGVMALSEMQKEIIIKELNRYLDEFTPSVEESKMGTLGLVSRFNKEHPEFHINGDTVEYLLKYKPKDPEQLKREYELDLQVFKNLKDILDLPTMQDLLKDLDYSRQPFYFDRIKKLILFFRTEKDPELYFMDEKLEDVRLKLLKNLRNFNSFLEEHSEGKGDLERYYIPRTLNGVDRKDVLKQINETASIAWEDYSLFIKLGREKFGI
jgi:hypothetical protein